jgi:hypothetical protein
MVSMPADFSALHRESSMNQKGLVAYLTMEIAVAEFEGSSTVDICRILRREFSLYIPDESVQFATFSGRALS